MSSYRNLLVYGKDTSNWNIVPRKFIGTGVFVNVFNNK